MTRPGPVAGRHRVQVRVLGFWLDVAATYATAAEATAAASDHADRYAVLARTANPRSKEPLMTTPTVTIEITYSPGVEAAVAAAQAVQVACDPYWVRPAGSAVRTPGLAVVTIRADGWPPVAAVIREARRSAGPGWSVNVTSAGLTPDEVLAHPTF
jgi:hypothetical protein